MSDFKLSAVVTDLGNGYVVSVSKVTKGGDIEVLAENDVDSLSAAHDVMKRVAAECASPEGRMETLYNTNGKITRKPPRGRT